MGQIEKLINRVLSVPKDLTYDELKRFLHHYGYKEDSKGATSGSRVAFIRQQDKASVILHKPHPTNIVQGYAIRQIIKHLQEIGDLE